MNRDLWTRLLMVGVAAPYLYKLSKKEQNDYFNVGLKMLAGVIIVTNIKPILVQAAPVLKVLSDAAVNQARTLTAEVKAEAIDGEFTTTKTV